MRGLDRIEILGGHHSCLRDSAVNCCSLASCMPADDVLRGLQHGYWACLTDNV